MSGGGHVYEYWYQPMEREPSKREQKRDSARKHKERAIYTKKAVRVKEAQREKFVSRHGQGSTSD